MKTYNRKVCLVSEALGEPFDEGTRVFARRLLQFLSTRCHALGLRGTAVGDIPNSAPVTYRKRLVTAEVTRRLRDFNPDWLVYVPANSLTTWTLARLVLVRRVFPGLPVAVFALQPRDITLLGRLFARAIGPITFLVQSPESEAALRTEGWNAQWFPAGVDTDVFRPVSSGERRRLRREHGMADDRFVLLHVGHLKGNRNLQAMQRLQLMDGVQVVMVASTSTGPKARWSRRLADAGVTLVTHYVESIRDFYQMADAYLFPVEDRSGAIEGPLSVLEALACGLPVLSTRFGALPHMFPDGEGIIYFRGANDLLDGFQRLRAAEDLRERARRQAERYEWSRVLEEALTAAGVLS